MPLLEEFREAGLGTLSEVYDGDGLKARGAPSYALSVAEILRAYVEDYKKTTSNTSLLQQGYSNQLHK